MAIEIRLGEKEILASSLGFIDKEVASLLEDTKIQDDRPSKKAKRACNLSAHRRYNPEHARRSSGRPNT